VRRTDGSRVVTEALDPPSLVELATVDAQAVALATRQVNVKLLAAATVDSNQCSASRPATGTCRDHRPVRGSPVLSITRLARLAGLRQAMLMR
jgi:hypothetical protein